jgi:hypothetical protein
MGEYADEWKCSAQTAYSDAARELSLKMANIWLEAAMRCRMAASRRSTRRSATDMSSILASSRSLRSRVRDVYWLPRHGQTPSVRFTPKAAATLADRRVCLGPIAGPLHGSFRICETTSLGPWL